MESLNLKKRDITKKIKAKQLRRSGRVPGILYNKNMNNFMFEVGELELCREISEIGDHGILNFQLDGKDKKALIKDVQRDPVTGKIIHIDLQELEKNQKVISSIPIQYIGEGLLNKKGMVVQKERESVKVEGVAEKLPKSIKINMANLNKGAVYKIADLEVASELSIVDDINTVVASVSYERRTVSENNEAAEEDVENDK
ncbi:MAG: 50S ribosomal protein L25 [Clostridiales bacterium]|nr:50S ribosomal protein L25 [Clostridiales bacterium]